MYRATLKEGLDHEQHRMWVASLELKRPALIGTPVPGRSDYPMVAWLYLLKSHPQTPAVSSPSSGDAGWRCSTAGVVSPCIPVKADRKAAGIGVRVGWVRCSSCWWLCTGLGDAGRGWLSPRSLIRVVLFLWSVADEERQER